MKNVILIKDLLNILKKNKNWFIVTFLIVVIGGSIFTFLRPEIYSMETSIVLSENDNYYNDFLLERFPEETKSLWLHDESDINLAENKVLDTISTEVSSEKFLYKLKNSLDFEIGVNYLKNSIYAFRIQPRVLNIKVVGINNENVYEKLEKLIALMKNNKKAELETALSTILEKIDEEIEILSKQQTGHEDTLEKEQVILDDDSLYNGLIIARESLLGNKDYFTDRIELVEEFNISDVYQYTSRKKDIFITLSLGVFLGLVVSFSRFYFNLLKSNKN